jgi:competence protein ComEC
MSIQFKTAPALCYGILVLLGTACALAFHPVYVVPLALCLVFHGPILYKAIAFLVGFCWAFLMYELPQLPEEGIEKEAVFTLQTLSYSHSPFQRSLLYKGYVGSFCKKIPCHIYFPENKPHPTRCSSFHVKGRLIPKGDHHYVFKPIAWKPLSERLSLAEWRFDVKNRLRDKLTPHFPHPKNRALVLSLLTGDIDDRGLALEFNRLGILHLLGISGFQFSLLAFLMGTLLRLVMPYRAASFFLMLLLSAYTFILGDSPPIERAWISTLLSLIALLCGWRVVALNALGVALLWQLFKNPLIIFHLGFQFSFLCTAAILITYPLLKSLISLLFPRRSFADTLRLDVAGQHGHLLSFFFREALALNGAIHLVTLPLIFYHFHKFPTLSFAYNLFLPALFSGIYVLLVLGVLLPLIGPLLLTLTGKLTQGILNVATHPPALYDFQWRVADFSITTAVLAITLILFYSYYISTRNFITLENKDAPQKLKKG